MNIYMLLVAICVMWMPQQTPARDTSVTVAAATGSGVIRGVVVAAASGGATDDASRKPLRQVRVALGGVPGGRYATTDAMGAFSFTGLPAGTYTLTASKAAYLTTAFGAGAPGRAGTTIVLSDKQVVEATINLVPGGVIGGVIRDGRGRPLPGTDVGVVPLPTLDVPRPSFSGAPATTDDRGEYRLYGVPPGHYYVVAAPGGYMPSAVAGRRTVEENDALLEQLQRRGSGAEAPVPGAPPKKIEPLPNAPTSAYAPIYYPGTPRVDDASVVTVSAGAERLGVDFSFAPVRAATVEGSVQGAVSNLARVELNLMIDGPQFQSFSGGRPILSQSPDAQGRFRYQNMAPGRYTILARALEAESGPAPPPGQNGTFSVSSPVGSSSAPAEAPEGRDYLFARADLDIDGGDVGGVALSLMPGAIATGIVKFEPGTAAVPTDLASLLIRFAYPSAVGTSISNGTTIGTQFLAGPTVSVRPDGTWTARGIPPATFNVSATLPAAISKDWRLRSAMLDGRDLLDGPIDVLPGQTLSGIVFTLIDRHSELSGAITGATGRPVSDYVVVVLPVDQQLWTRGSRRIKSVRPGTDGRFSIKDLPSGDYLIAAVTDVLPSDLMDAQWLSAVAAAGVKVTITDGGKTIQDLRVAQTLRLPLMY